VNLQIHVQDIRILEPFDFQTLQVLYIQTAIANGKLDKFVLYIFSSQYIEEHKNRGHLAYKNIEITAILNPIIWKVDHSALRQFLMICIPDMSRIRIQYPSESRTVRLSNGHLSDIFVSGFRMVFFKMAAKFGRHFVFSDRKLDRSFFNF
jgi:hypothetical protein